MHNKSVLVTGGAKGIGSCIVKKFADMGYNVLINYHNSEGEAKKLKEEMCTKYPDLLVEVFKADISKREEVNSMIDFMLKKFGRIDTVVNNSGIAKSKIFNDIKVEELKEMFDINIIGTFNVTQEALNRYMINKKCGSIINISSIWGITGASMEVAYSTTKAGIIGMSKALAKELGPSNIRVNVIAPGWIDTDMTKNYTDEEKEMFISEVPLGRLGYGNDIAGLCYFLASDESNYITGQVISPNGGYLV